MEDSNYVVPFRVLLRQVSIDDNQFDNDKIMLTRDQLFTLIRSLLASTPFDEGWYKKTYPDVEQAITSGTTTSAKQHYLSNGYFEGRLPGPITVDEKYYVTTYPDVAEGIEYGEISSAQDHFERHGLMEGRLPRKVVK